MPVAVTTHTSIVKEGLSGARIEKTEAKIVYTNPDGSAFTSTLADYIVMAASGDYIPGSNGSFETAQAVLVGLDLEFVNTHPSTTEPLEVDPTTPRGGRRRR